MSECRRGSMATPFSNSSGEGGSLSHLFTSHSIEVVVPIVDAGVEVGHLDVLSDAGDLFEGLIRSALMSLAGTALALVVGLALATRLHAAIIRPLKRLTEAMTRVRDEHDYSAQLPEQGRDEIGVLVSGYNAMLSDIRERDQRLVLHRDRLEQDVADRTQDLAVARDEAERANAAKSDFLATMSHEIRTPMSGLLVMAELLASGELPPRSRRYAEVISQSGQALLAIINDILDFAKIEAGKMELESVAVDLEQVTGTVLNLFHARAREKGLDLAARISPDVPATIAADPVRLNQIISNLVGNALKFTERGSVAIEISRLAGPDCALRVAVTDTGIGIPADKLGAIFEAFGQADQSTTRRFGGTGLGLAISNRLVRAMGGVLRVESRPGEGSSFFFELRPTTASAAHVWPQAGRDGTRVSARMVVAGDATRRAIAAMLDASGFAVDSTAEDLRDAEHCRLLIGDAARLLAAPARPAADYVVALAEPDDADTGLAGRADLVFTRPILPAELRTMLGQVARGEPLHASARARQTKQLPSYPQARVLAADDAIVNREVLSEALRRFGIQPLFVTNGAEALEALAREPFDLVLMDGSMPVLDGFEAARRRRSQETEEHLPRTPIIALTAHVVGTAATAWRDAGMDGILHKPFTMDDLDRCLATWLGGATAQPASEPVAFDGEIPLLNSAILDDIASMSGASGGGFAQRVFGLYREHAPLALEQIEAATRESDREAVAAAAHALKSMSHNVGAARVAALAEAVERAARETGAELAKVVQLREALGQTLSALPRSDDLVREPGSVAALG